MNNNRLKGGLLKFDAKTYYVYEGVNSIGRNRTSVINIKDINVSQHHGVLVLVNNKMHFISDLNSSNGTFLNGSKLQPLKLYSINDSDVIKFGNSEGVYTKGMLGQSFDMTSQNEDLTQNYTQSIYDANTQEDTLQHDQNKTAAILPEKNEEDNRKGSVDMFKNFLNISTQVLLKTADEMEFCLNKTRNSGEFVKPTTSRLYLYSDSQEAGPSNANFGTSSENDINVSESNDSNIHEEKSPETGMLSKTDEEVSFHEMKTQKVWFKNISEIQKKDENVHDDKENQAGDVNILNDLGDDFHENETQIVESNKSEISFHEMETQKVECNKKEISFYEMETQKVDNQDISFHEVETQIVESAKGGSSVEENFHEIETQIVISDDEMQEGLTHRSPSTELEVRNEAEEINVNGNVVKCNKVTRSPSTEIEIREEEKHTNVEVDEDNAGNTTRSSSQVVEESRNINNTVVEKSLLCAPSSPVGEVDDEEENVNRICVDETIISGINRTNITNAIIEESVLIEDSDSSAGSIDFWTMQKPKSATSPHKENKRRSSDKLHVLRENSNAMSENVESGSETEIDSDSPASSSEIIRSVKRRSRAILSTQESESNSRHTKESPSTPTYSSISDQKNSESESNGKEKKFSRIKEALDSDETDDDESPIVVKRRPVKYFIDEDESSNEIEPDVEEKKKNSSEKSKSQDSLKEAEKTLNKNSQRASQNKIVGQPTENNIENDNKVSTIQKGSGITQLKKIEEIINENRILDDSDVIPATQDMFQSENLQPDESHDRSDKSTSRNETNKDINEESPSFTEESFKLGLTQLMADGDSLNEPTFSQTIQSIKKFNEVLENAVLIQSMSSNSKSDNDSSSNASPNKSRNDVARQKLDEVDNDDVFLTQDDDIYDQPTQTDGKRHEKQDDELQALSQADIYEVATQALDENIQKNDDFSFAIPKKTYLLKHKTSPKLHKTYGNEEIESSSKNASVESEIEDLFATQSDEPILNKKPQSLNDSVEDADLEAILDSQKEISKEAVGKSDRNEDKPKEVSLESEMEDLFATQSDNSPVVAQRSPNKKVTNLITSDDLELILNSQKPIFHEKKNRNESKSNKTMNNDDDEDLVNILASQRTSLSLKQLKLDNMSVKEKKRKPDASFVKELVGILDDQSKTISKNEVLIPSKEHPFVENEMEDMFATQTSPRTFLKRKTEENKTSSSVESQLEVLFLSQTVKPIDSNRPSNPLIRVWEENDAASTSAAQDQNSSKNSELKNSFEESFAFLEENKYMKTRKRTTKPTNADIKLSVSQTETNKKCVLKTADEVFSKEENANNKRTKETTIVNDKKNMRSDKKNSTFEKDTKVIGTRQSKRGNVSDKVSTVKGIQLLKKNNKKPIVVSSSDEEDKGPSSDQEFAPIPTESLRKSKRETTTSTSCGKTATKEADSTVTRGSRKRGAIEKNVEVQLVNVEKSKLDSGRESKITQEEVPLKRSRRTVQESSIEKDQQANLVSKSKETVTRKTRNRDAKESISNVISEVEERKTDKMKNLDEVEAVPAVTRRRGRTTSVSSNSSSISTTSTLDEDNRQSNSKGRKPKSKASLIGDGSLDVDNRPSNSRGRTPKTKASLTGDSTLDEDNRSSTSRGRKPKSKASLIADTSQAKEHPGCSRIDTESDSSEEIRIARVNKGKSIKIKSKQETPKTDEEENIDFKIPQKKTPTKRKTDTVFETPSSSRRRLSVRVELISTPERSRRKQMPKIVFTMMESLPFESLIKQLGGSVVDTVDACTVLVTACVKRSHKLLTAVGQSKPICSPKWLEACKKSNQFLDPWDHLLIDNEAETKWDFSLEESLKRSSERKLLDGYTFQINVTQAVDVLKGAIEACGGKHVKKLTGKVDNFYVVSSSDNRSSYSRLLKKDPNLKILEPEAIFDSVLRQDIRFEKHILK